MSTGYIKTSKYLLLLFPCLLLFQNCSSPKSSDSNGSPDAAATPTPASIICTSSNVYKIKVPVYPDRAGSPTYDYSYQVRASNYSPEKPWVIVLTGGPGEAAIGSDFGGVPPSFNVIYTDQRSIGCNALPNGELYSADALTTEYLASDVLALIKEGQSKGLLTNYYIYGISYGSIQATVLTALIERQGLIPPKGLILSGVVGKSYANYGEYLAGFNEQWNRLKVTLEPSVLSGLSSGNYLGYTASQWMAYMAGRLDYGDIVGVGPLVSNELNPLASSDPNVVNAAKAKIDQLIKKATSRVVPENVLWIKAAIGCREIFGTQQGITFEGGAFVLSGSDFCKPSGFSLTNPYDVKNYQVKTPIFYLQGVNDPFTPYSRAVYDFESQVYASRTFILLGYAGHRPLEYQLTEKNATSNFWDNIAFAPPEALRPGLTQTGIPFDLYQAPADLIK